MSADSKKYVPPVQGRHLEVSATQIRVDPNNLDKFTDLAVDFVDSQPDDTWTNAFFITSDSYKYNYMPVDGRWTPQCGH